MARQSSSRALGGRDIAKCIQDLLRDAKTTPKMAREQWQQDLLKLDLDQHGARCETLKQLIEQSRQEVAAAQTAMQLTQKSSERWDAQHQEEWKNLDTEKQSHQDIIKVAKTQESNSSAIVRMHMITHHRAFKKWAKNRGTTNTRGWLGRQWDKVTGYNKLARTFDDLQEIFDKIERTTQQSQQEINRLGTLQQQFVTNWERDNEPMISKHRAARATAKQEYQRALSAQSQLEDQLSSEQRQAARKINSWGEKHQHVLTDQIKQQRFSSSSTSSSDTPSTDMVLLSMLGAHQPHSLGVFHTIVASSDPQSFGGGSFHTGGGIDGSSHCSAPAHDSTPTYDTSSYSSDSGSSSVSCD